MEHLLERLESLEGELDGMYRELERTQRLSMLGEIAAIIAHEFNNLLTPIRSYAQLALEGDDPEMTRKALEQALVASTRAGRISSSILGLARDDSPGRATPVQVQSCVAEVFLCLARDPARDGIALDLDI
ncbi:MAG: hypothetical protein KDA28_08050, partial [Phycisphaerales bacterium]|nr:hypothetical protein [Phycisphaerales bacterium]